MLIKIYKESYRDIIKLQTSKYFNLSHQEKTNENKNSEK